MAEHAPGTAAVSDRRTAPRGVLPRSAQTWLLAALAFGILAIIVVTGRPEPAPRPTVPAANQPTAPSPDRLRDYQDRLRVLDERSRQQALSQAVETPAPLLYENAATTPPSVDPLEAEKKRREYESLFASNVVVSRRPDGQTPSVAEPVSASRLTRLAERDPLSPPTLDDVADAVIRATARHSPNNASAPLASSSLQSGEALTPPKPQPLTNGRSTPESTGPIRASGPLHRILEGTFIDTVLTNRLDGSSAAPVNCLVTNPVYSHSGQHVLIPAGARILGETKPVQALGETRLAVVFHRVLLPDGRTYGLNQFNGLNQVGDAGLRDRVNQHYLSTFGASAAVGLITGLSQFVGNVGFGGDGDRTIVIAGGVGNATSQATGQVMNRFLNRLPTITIREGHRVKVYLTADVELPAYEQ
jgi:type IV secretion system protein VirB10